MHIFKRESTRNLLPCDRDTGTPRYRRTELSCGDQEGIIREADVNAGYSIRPEPSDAVRLLETLGR